MRRKYNFQEIEKWTTEFKKVWSYSEVAKKFGVSSKDTRYYLLKYKDELGIKSKEEFLLELNSIGKHYCFCCYQIKSMDEFRLRSDTKKYKNKCRNCINADVRKRYAKNEEIRIKNKEKQRQPRYLEMKRIWVKNNPDKIKQATLRYKEKEENKSKIKARRRKYKKENRDKINAKRRERRNKNKEKTNAQKRKWRRDNPDKVRAIKQRRRERKAGLGENYSSRDNEITVELFFGRCFNCGSDKNLCIDHHRPLSKGFALSVENAVVLCKSCNSSKGIKMPDDFYDELQLQNLEKIFEQARILKKKANQDVK